MGVGEPDTWVLCQLWEGNGKEQGAPTPGFSSGCGRGVGGHWEGLDAWVPSRLCRQTGPLGGYMGPLAPDPQPLTPQLWQCLLHPTQFNPFLPTALDTDLEQIDFIDSSVNGEEDEEAKPEVRPDIWVLWEGSRALGACIPGSHALPLLCGPQEKLKVEPSPAPSTLPRPAPPREDPPGEERRRPETLQLWQERERQQQALETRNRYRGRGGCWPHGNPPGAPRNPCVSRSFRRMPRTSSGLAPGRYTAQIPLGLVPKSPWGWLLVASSLPIG